jgi:TetR/AcrR family transcriptional regulator
MVSYKSASPRSRAARGRSRDRLLEAAAEAFAARGFDGATVDRIAAAARVNKAMIYYHFKSKAALYRIILRELFACAADAVHRIRDDEAPPDDRLRRFVQAVADDAVTRPHFSGIWLREMADGGRHLDAAVVAEMGRILDALRGILEDGRRHGRFRAANPLVVHMGIVAPLLLFTASAPVRGRFARHLPPHAADMPRDAIVQHVQDVTLLALTTGRALSRSKHSKRTKKTKKTRKRSAGA